MQMLCTGGAVARRGLAAGLQSRDFTPHRLQRAAEEHDRAPVYIDMDSAGYLSAARGEAELLAARARLAPHVLAAHAVLCLAPAPAPAPAHTHSPALRLRLVRDLPPLHEMLLWFEEPVLAAIDMPFLTLRNIRGKKNYECHECGERFEEPNPLKTHLFLRCGTLAPARLWRAVAARLAPSPPAPGSAFGRVRPPPEPLEPAAAARLEALAAEWGRGRGGHACLYCGKLYSRKYGLKIHIRTHTGYRPLRCAHCARAFGDPSNLNKHVRLHGAGGAGGAGGATRHACARCGRVLARRRDLARHRAHCASPPAPTASGCLAAS